MSTAYSPQSDGQTEMLNRTLEQYVRMYIDLHSNNWSQLLTPAEYAYNSVIHQSTGFSPFQLDCGRNPADPMFMFRSAADHYSTASRVINSVDDFLRQMVMSWEQARKCLELTQRTMKKYYDKSHEAGEFKVGDEVYLNTKREKDFQLISYASTTSSTKFQAKYLGPFKIIQKVSSHAYKLDLPISIKIHPVIHIRYLKKPKYANPLKYPIRIPSYMQPPVVVDNELEFEVEAIIKRRLRKVGRGKRLEYLIQWKGYPSEYDTWEPLGNLTHCDDILRDFDILEARAARELVVHTIHLV